MLTIYDWHGNYGHPDHIKVHTVGHRAAELAGTPAVFEATMNRDAMKRFFDMARENGRAERPRRRGLGPRWSGRRRQPVRHAGERADPHGRRQRVRRAQAGVHPLPQEPGHRRRLLHLDARRGVRDGVRHRVVHPQGRRRIRCARAGCSNDPRVPGAPRPRRGRVGHRPRSGPRCARPRPGGRDGRTAGAARARWLW